jgi:hypothetical protein
MQHQTHIRLREALVQAILDHRQRAHAALFGRLPNEDELDLPFLLRRCQCLRRADPAGHDHIMTAGMHDGDVVACIVLGGRMANIGTEPIWRTGGPSKSVRPRPFYRLHSSKRPSAESGIVFKIQRQAQADGSRRDANERRPEGRIRPSRTLGDGHNPVRVGARSG